MMLLTVDEIIALQEKVIARTGGSVGIGASWNLRSTAQTAPVVADAAGKLVNEAGVCAGVRGGAASHPHDGFPNDNLGGNLPFHTFRGRQGAGVMQGAVEQHQANRDSEYWQCGFRPSGCMFF